jgi:hypothetical protein
MRAMPAGLAYGKNALQAASNTSAAAAEGKRSISSRLPRAGS